MIKKILIGFGIIIVIAGATIGVLYLVKQSQPKIIDTDTKKDTNTVLDFSKDYGACRIVDEPSIKSSLGDIAKDLQPAKNVGIVGNVYVGKGVDDMSSDSQSCVYAFASGGTLENGFNSGNGLTVSKMIFNNTSGSASYIKQIRENTLITEISGIGDSAFYSSSTASVGPNAVYSYQLEVFDGQALYQYTIRQPAEKAVFTANSGQSALVTLVKKAKTN